MYKKVSEIVEIIENYHKGLSKYFIALKEKSTSARVDLLLDYLGGSEGFMAEYLEKYRKSTSDRIMNSWVKYVPWLPTDVFCECRENILLQPPLDTFNVLEAAVHFDDCLINFYTTLVNELQDNVVAEIFTNLLRVTKKHEMNLSRDIAWLNDL